MAIRLHSHAKARAVERGVTEAEIIATVEEGEHFPVKYGRTGFRRNFSFNGMWGGKHYLVKQVEAYAVKEAGDWIVCRDGNNKVFLKGGAGDMRFTYDPKYNIAYLKFREKSAEVHTLKVSDELNIDLASDGTIYGIELLNANEQIYRQDEGKFLLINEVTGEKVELSINR